MAMLMAARAAFSMEANGCETKRVSTERAAGLSLGPTDVMLRSLMSGSIPQTRSLKSSRNQENYILDALYVWV